MKMAPLEEGSVNATKNYLAFDIGASNGRCVIGEFDGATLSLKVLHRFDNGYIRVRDHLYWNILGLWSNLTQSLAMAGREVGADIVALGVDTWGVDFGLLDKSGNLLANPYCYRDPHTTGKMAEALRLVPLDEMFQITGIQFMEINTLFQLFAMVRAGSPALDIAATLLLIPDLLNYWLSGEKACEYTNASITQAMDVRSRQWAFSMLDKLGIPGGIFPEIVPSGTVLGTLVPVLIQATGLKEIPVIAGGTHDTAAAVAAVPAMDDDFAYLSSGTWGLLGAEIPGPLLDKKVLLYNFGNEGGVFNTVRLLRNVMNMWLVQECLRIWKLEGQLLSWEAIAQMAQQAPPFTAFINPDDPDFLLPDDMPEVIQAYCARTNQNVPQTQGEILRVCLESLSFKYRYNFEKLTDLLGREPKVFHIVGGASRNRLLNQFAANAIGRPVVSGPAEATALGNLLVQMIVVGDLKDLAEGRDLLRSSFPTETFLPQDTDLWEEQYNRFLRITSLPVAII